MRKGLRRGRLSFALAFASIFSLSPFAKANDEASSAAKRPELSKSQALLVEEGLILLNAGMATPYPKVYGVAAFVIAPLGVAESRDLSEGILGAVGLAGIGTMDVAVLDRHKDSSAKIFLLNLAAWQVLLGADHIIERRDRKSRDKAVYFLPMTNGGGALYAVWKF